MDCSLLDFFNSLSEVKTLPLTKLASLHLCMSNFNYIIGMTGWYLYPRASSLNKTLTSMLDVLIKHNY